MPPSAKKRLEWTPIALNELLAGLEIIAEDNPTAALLVYERIDRVAELLAIEHGLGRPGRVAKTKEFPVPRTSFTLVYLEKGATLHIVHCLHQRRRYP